MQSVRELSGGDLRLWIEQQQSICLRAIDRHGDAIELSLDEAQDLVNVLQGMIADISSREVD